MIGAATLGLPLVALGQHQSVYYLMAAAGLAGIGSTVGTVAWDTALQRAVPSEKLSRVLAFDDMGSYFTILIAVILAVPVADRLGVYPVAWVGGILLIGAALAPLVDRTLRLTTMEELERRPPTPRPPRAARGAPRAPLP